MLRTVFACAFSALSLFGIGFYAFAIRAARQFALRRPPAPGYRPPVSLLKPLRGADEHTYAALRSHCVQDYPDYEVLFGVRESHDLAVQIVERLKEEFPEQNLQLVVCPEKLGSNGKVSTLIQLMSKAKAQYLLVSEGDISVSPAYLDSVMRHFADPEVGMVTCPYRGVAGNSVSSRLEALGISTDFIAGVLVVERIEHGLHFGLGSTLAISRDALQAIGGFEAVADYLADDYELGRRISEAGYKVLLANEVVETSTPAYSFSQFWKHQMRWARTMRTSRPSDYRGVALTFALPWAICAVLSKPCSWTWALLAFATAVRFPAAFQLALTVLKDAQIKRDFWLLPIRDVLALLIFAGSYFSDKISWGGEEFRVKAGKLVRGT